MLVLKALAIWVSFLIVSMLNGMGREQVLSPIIGESIALPLSGLTLSAFIFIITYSTIHFFGRLPTNAYVSIGLLWLGITLAFEFSFANITQDRNWRDIIPMLNPLSGNLLLLVLAVTAVAPWSSAKLKKLI